MELFDSQRNYAIVAHDSSTRSALRSAHGEPPLVECNPRNALEAMCKMSHGLPDSAPFREESTSPIKQDIRGLLPSWRWLRAHLPGKGKGNQTKKWRRNEGALRLGDLEHDLAFKNLEAERALTLSALLLRCDVRGVIFLKNELSCSIF